MLIQIKLNGNLIELVTEFKFLGCTIDRNLNLKARVKFLVKNVYAKLFAIKKIFFFIKKQYIAIF